jgi:multidrug resistance efflux pump
MDTVEAKAKAAPSQATPVPVPPPAEPVPPPHRRHPILRVLITLVAVGVAAFLGWTTWNSYMGTPWTRDGTVRAYVVTMAPEVSGLIVQLPIKDNQLVRKGDLLLQIEPTNYRIAVSLAQAAVQQAQINAENAAREAKRRLELSSLAVTVEEQQTYQTTAVATQAQLEQATANLDQAKVNLQRSEIRSPVNGWVTNLTAQLGDYASVGVNQISLVDADSYWIDGYFEETALGEIHDGDQASIKLMGYDQIIRGHVASVARGISVANAQPNGQGLATVNPIFTWVRLAQRVPVRIAIDKVPDGVRLVAGQTATVQIDPALKN